MRKPCARRLQRARGYHVQSYMHAYIVAPKHKYVRASIKIAGCLLLSVMCCGGGREEKRDSMYIWLAMCMCMRLPGHARIICMCIDDRRTAIVIAYGVRVLGCQQRRAREKETIRLLRRTFFLSSDDAYVFLGQGFGNFALHKFQRGASTLRISS